MSAPQPNTEPGAAARAARARSKAASRPFGGSRFAQQLCEAIYGTAQGAPPLTVATLGQSLSVTLVRGDGTIKGRLHSRAPAATVIIGQGQALEILAAYVEPMMQGLEARQAVGGELTAEETRLLHIWGAARGDSPVRLASPDASVAVTVAKLLVGVGGEDLVSVAAAVRFAAFETAVETTESRSLLAVFEALGLRAKHRPQLPGALSSTASLRAKYGLQ